MEINSDKLRLPDHRWERGTHVDLGAGRFPRNPLRSQLVIGVDILAEAPFQETSTLRYARTRPGAALPLTTASADSISAYDFLEHLPRHAIRQDGTSGNYFIEIMNEVHRVLRPGGLFIALTPCFPAESTFVDPTHVNHIAVGTIDYFAGPAHARALGYGFEGQFDCIAQGWIRASDPLWHTQEPDVRDLQSPWLQSNRLGMHQQARRLAGRLLRAARLRPSEQLSHYLWLLKKTEI